MARHARSPVYPGVWPLIKKTRAGRKANTNKLILKTKTNTTEKGDAQPRNARGDSLQGFDILAILRNWCGFCVVFQRSFENNLKQPLDCYENFQKIFNAIYRHFSRPIALCAHKVGIESGFIEEYHIARKGVYPLIDKAKVMGTNNIYLFIASGVSPVKSEVFVWAPGHLAHRESTRGRRKR